MLKEIFGSPREAALDEKEFRIVPHRTDGKDDDDSWAWKIQTWENGHLTKSEV